VDGSFESVVYGPRIRSDAILPAEPDKTISELTNMIVLNVNSASLEVGGGGS